MGAPEIYTFTGYRPAAAELGKHNADQLNPPDEAQYQGVVFADGSVAIRWCTALRSTSVWSDFATFFGVHGHPEYGTVIVWGDGRGGPADAEQTIAAAYAELAQRPDPGPTPEIIAAAQSEREAFGLARAQLAQAIPGAAPDSSWAWLLNEVRLMGEDT
jgi:hypothetical protein